MQKIIAKDAIHDSLLLETRREIERLNEQVLNMEKKQKKYESGNKNGDKETVIIMARSCYEALSIDPTLPSGNYFIDPDGTNTGDSPIYVYCNMNTGFYMYALISYLSGT